MQHMRALTLASAKHLLSQGHITPQQHAGIVAKVGAPKRKKPPQPVRGFGSLAQQAQAPIPGLGAIPEGTASGYE